jgi:hypothetical protein
MIVYKEANVNYLLLFDEAPTPPAHRIPLGVDTLAKRVDAQHALRFLFPQLWPEAEADSVNR